MSFFKNLFNNNSKNNDETQLVYLIGLRSLEVFKLIEQVYLLLDEKKINNIYYRNYLIYVSTYIAGATYVYNLSKSGYFKDSEEYKKVSRVVYASIIFDTHKEYIITNKIRGLEEEEFWVSLGGEIGYFMQIKKKFDLYLLDFKYLKETDEDCYALSKYDSDGDYYGIVNYYFIDDIFKYDFIENSEGITLKLKRYSEIWPDGKFLQSLMVLNNYLKLHLK